MNSRPYVVTNTKTGEIRLIKAKNDGQVAIFLLLPEIEIAPAKTSQLTELWNKGIPIEDAETKATTPTTEPPAG